VATLGKVVLGLVWGPECLLSAVLQSVQSASAANTPQWRCFPGGEAGHLPPSIAMSGAMPPCIPVMSWRVQGSFIFTLMALLLGG